MRITSKTDKLEAERRRLRTQEEQICTESGWKPSAYQRYVLKAIQNEVDRIDCELMNVAD